MAHLICGRLPEFGALLCIKRIREQGVSTLSEIRCSPQQKFHSRTPTSPDFQRCWVPPRIAPPKLNKWDHRFDPESRYLYGKATSGLLYLEHILARQLGDSVLRFTLLQAESGPCPILARIGPALQVCVYLRVPVRNPPSTWHPNLSRLQFSGGDRGPREPWRRAN